MNSTILVLTTACLMVMAGCGGPQPDTSMTISSGPASTVSSGRITITRIGVFEDEGLAYNDRRGIYIIKDTKTKKEYVGITGIGISELDSVVVGSDPVVTVPVER